MSIRGVGIGLGVVVWQAMLVGASVRADDEAKGGLALTASQTDFLRQEPILVTVRIEDSAAVSAETELPAEVGAGKSAATGLRFEIEPAVKPRSGAKPLPAEARTASARSRKYDLLEWYQFPPSGTFTVRAVLDHAGARLVSVPLRVTLRAPAQGDPEFDAVARIHHVPWSNYETNAYCGDTADVVKRWPDSRLARYCHYWNARYAQHQHDYDQALASYETVIARYPDFPLADDARQGIAECRAAREKK